MTARLDKRAKARSVRERAQAIIYGFLVTLVALPAAAAIPIPDDPLTTEARVEPNILFIMDDSGSMGWTYMPDGVPNDWRRETYTHNTIYYNPNVTYEPWITASGTPMTGGLSYDSVYSSATHASGSTNLYGGTRTFYVPKDISNQSAAYLNNQANYWRYQIRTDGRVIKSEYLQGGNHPEGLSGVGCSSGTGGNTWRWKNCEEATPTGRSQAGERANFAAWYSYHRTRAKVAKAGSGRAFSEIGKNVRVGFRTIHRRNDASISGNPITQDIPIPVGRNKGLFDDPYGVNGKDNNRTMWYDRLYSATASGVTPLRDALNRAGQYYSSKDEDGPYGPGKVSEQYACRQNFTILTTDGYRNDGDPLTYNYGSPVGEQDDEPGPVIENPNGDDYQYVPKLPYSSAHSNSLADIAMRYWKRDLRTDLDNIVPSTSANPAFWQHMVTFAISIGAAGTLNPEADLPAITAGTKEWPLHTNNHAHSIDDLWHATVNGRGSFILANDPGEFNAALKGALGTILDRAGSFSNVAANSTSLDTGTRLFQASYIAGTWTGKLTSSPIDNSGALDDPSWSASIPATGRRVLTRNGLFPGSATADQLAALSRTGGPTNFPVTGENNAAYIAGSRALEMSQGGTLRNRSHLLGDIVGSSPAFSEDVGAVFVGANDGMLHAFDSDSGEELFAFIPSGINWSDLGSLSRPDYTHRYFVDGPLVVSDRTITPGRNILVGTLGRGGRGLFALDVSNPSSLSASDVLWEAYDSVDSPLPNMGLVQGAPLITKVRSASGTPQTVVIVGNGVNSANNRAVLFVYDLATGALLRQIDTGEGAADDPNGLSAPVGWDANADGIVEYVYAGDMHGNVWKFDLGAAPSSWTIANSGEPLFVATDGDGKRQPISGRLTVGLHPANFSTWVFFGTGRFLTIGDMTDPSVQSLYGIMDKGAPVSKNSLVERKTTLIGNTHGFPVRSFESASPLPANHPITGNPVGGWYVNLLEPPAQSAVGERVLTEVQVINRVLVVATVIPMVDPCLPSGRGYLNALDAFTGTSLSAGSFFDLDRDGDFSDEVVGAGDDAPPVGSVDLGIGMPTLPNLLRELAATGGSTGETETVPILDARFTGRVSWREEVEE